jgi:hypothetical protein
MSKETFVVGCEGIGFHNGVVMVDLVGLSTTQKDAEGRPLREPRLRLIMTPDGMLETMNALQGMVNHLVERGVLKRTEGAPPQAGSEQAAPAAGPGNGGPKSPNF